MIEKKNIKKCGECIYFDCGICDIIGYDVEYDDEPVCRNKFTPEERKRNENTE